MSKNLYGSDTGLIDAGIIYDQTEARTQDDINAELVDKVIVSNTQPSSANNLLWVGEGSTPVEVATYAELNAFYQNLQGVISALGLTVVNGKLCGTYKE